MTLEEFKNHVLPAKNKLFRFALNYLKNKEEAEDVVQDVLIKIWNKNEQIEFYKNIEAWCMTMTRNLSLDRLKSKHNHLNSIEDTYDLHVDEASPYEKTELEDAVGSVKGFISQLPEKQKNVIHFRDIEGLSYKEISEIMKIDMNQVKVNLFRARKTVKEKLLSIDNYGT